MVKTMQYIVSGQVQGVWFRASTQKKAYLLGITGFVKNLSSGQVEVVATGDEQQLKKLHDYVLQGPDQASVDSVITRCISVCEFPEFIIY